MRIVRSLTEPGRGSGRACLAIGFFDGVHLGHQQIIRQTIADARQHRAESLIVTFDVHPSHIVAPEREPQLIYPLQHKLRVLESLGVDTTLLLHFDRPFSAQTGEEFVRALVRELGQVRSICVGANFVFGHQRSGDVELLKRLGAELNFAVHGLAAVALDGQSVSSTRIRQAIAHGELDAAGQMLGRPYGLVGNVIAGDRLGHKLGFPTANLNVTGLVIPPHGVYSAQVRCNTKLHRAAVNIGRRPTLNSPAPELRVEAHLLQFEGDLYGQELELIMGEKLRDEKKFASLAELQAQIARDVAEARRR